MAISIDSTAPVLSGSEKRMAEMKKTQQMFFKLLMTQLKCQDIENTVDMNQMTQSLFQMNELQTLISIDGKLSDIDENLKLGERFGTASNMIGKYVLTKTNHVNIDQSTLPLNYLVKGEENSVNAMIRVINSNGNVVYEKSLKNVPTNSIQNLELNFAEGNTDTIPSGVYEIQVLAHDQNRNALSSEVYTVNKINQFLSHGEFIMNNHQKIKLEDVLAIQDQPSVTNLEYKKDRLKQNIEEFYS